MSRTYIHNESGRYKNVHEIDKVSIKLQKKWDRSNFDVDIQRSIRKYKIEQQAKEDMMNDLNAIK